MAFESSEISLDGGVAEVSYRSQEWPRTQYNGHTAATALMSLGDPESGPFVGLSVVTPDDEDCWTRTHSHRTDEFRVHMRGTCRAVGRHVLGPGEFAFQEAGMLYREGVGGRDDDVWSFQALGDRRGAFGVVPRGDNGNPKGQADISEEALEEIAAAAASLPGGAKGIPGVVTTLGSCRQGYLGGSFADAGGDGWRALAPGVDAAAGAWGDEATGPVVVLLHGAPRTAVLPRLSMGTESVFLVVGGSCVVGEAELSSGDVRVTAPDLTLNSVMAGDDGLDAMLFVADRRALPTVDGDADWQDAIDSLLGDVVLVGGRRAASA